MRDYKLLAEGLRYCSKHICNKECGYYEICHRERQDKYPSNVNVGFDAADAIEELLDELTTIRKQLPHWISVEDALPKSESMVLVATKYGGVYYGFLNHSGKFYTANNTLYDSWCWEPDVTHWMPLPAPPKGVE